MRRRGVGGLTLFAPYGDFVPHREAAGWAADVNDVISALEDLTGAGHAAEVIGLAEHAHRKADGAVQYIDDSDGWLSGISERLGGLHRRACEAASPDPLELARRLSDLELTSGLDAFHRAAVRAGSTTPSTGLAAASAPLPIGPGRTGRCGSCSPRCCEVAAMRTTRSSSSGTRFIKYPSVDSYRRLLTEADTEADRAGWQERAMTALQDRVAERRAHDQSPRSMVTTTPASALIEILLYEGDVESAWTSAVEYGCDQRLWLTLARARDPAHPLDSIPVYEREALAQIETKNNRGYRNAVDYLGRIRKLAIAAGAPERFDSLLSEVRVRHKPKRNLMALLGKQGW